MWRDRVQASRVDKPLRAARPNHGNWLFTVTNGILVGAALALVRLQQFGQFWFVVVLLFGWLLGRRGLTWNQQLLTTGIMLLIGFCGPPLYRWLIVR
jgi:hypothetical protein